jgi:hypothetical protein
MTVRGSAADGSGCLSAMQAHQAGLNALRQLLAALPRRQVAFYEDEVDIHLNPKIGLDWMVRGQQKEVVTPGQNVKRYLAGAVDVRTGRLTWVEGERKNSALFIALLERLVAFHPQAEVIIPTDPKTGKPRGFFRGRTWVRRFYRHHQVSPGDQIALERVGERRYRLSLAPNGNKDGGLSAAEFFAGIGLVRLALERQGWRVAFANDIDDDKAEMYRHNWPKDDHLVVGDIHASNAEEIPTCHLATASFPCNDLSIAGRWEGLNGSQSSTF